MTEREMILLDQFCAIPNGTHVYDDERFVKLALELIQNQHEFPESELQETGNVDENQMDRLNHAFYWIQKTYEILSRMSI